MLFFFRQTRDILRHVGCPNSVDFLFPQGALRPEWTAPETGSWVRLY